MDWDTYRRIPNGTRVLNHLYDQCVALANLFHEEVLHQPFVTVDSAFEWWTEYHNLPQLRDIYIQSQTPVPGALFVARGGIYDQPNGHIGSVIEVRDGGFATMEQNTGPYYPQRYVYRHFRVKGSNVLGFLVPRNNPAQAVTPAVPDKATTRRKNEDDNMIFIYKTQGGKTTYAVYVLGQKGSWWEFTGSQSQADAMASQRGNAMMVSPDTWNDIKKQHA